MVGQTPATEKTMSELVGPELAERRKSCIFSKLIVASILQEKKLRIPHKLIKKYGDELSSVAILTVPGGRVWVVELRKAKQKLWLETGWQQFVEFYSICVGYLLVFKYEGNSCFTVQIFDLTASEIKYPCSSLNSSQEPSSGKLCHVQKVIDVEDGDSAETMGSGPTCLSSISLVNKDFDESLDHDCAKCKNSALGASSRNLCLGQEANDFQATSQLTRDIGIQFSGAELMCNTDESELQFLHDAKRIKQETEPDSVVHVEPLIKYKVKEEFPDSGIYNKRRVVTTEERESAIRASAMFTPENPFCRIILRPSYVYKGLLMHVPASFARACLTGAEFITLEVSEGKRWRVRCLSGARGMKFSKGWPEFVWDNNLTDGDVCVFELINAKDFVLKVTIFRVLECAGSMSQ
ncbi:hypothetical protein SLA2020_141490 [Shorea laevis]